MAEAYRFWMRHEAELSTGADPLLSASQPLAPSRPALLPQFASSVAFPPMHKQARTLEKYFPYSDRCVYHQLQVSPFLFACPGNARALRRKET